MSPFSGRTVVVFHAHPDDEAIFTAATMRRLADAGARVVLVSATLGELGEVLVPLRRGETIAERRRAELEHASALLGVARLVLLGQRDSGLPGTDDNARPGALACADHRRIAHRLADIAANEQAEAIVHYDAHGIYGHPDHVAVHTIGSRVADRLGIPAYESTVDNEHLSQPGARSHLLHAAADAAGRHYGVPARNVSLAIDASPEELAAKRAAIAAHQSQIRPDAAAHDEFDLAYGREWYIRAGRAGILDELDRLDIDKAALTGAG